MKLLDLFCGAGGAAMGYYQAGFTEIVGVDIEPQKRYPFDFIKGDAFNILARYGSEFDLIHASPPCQRYSVATPTDAKRLHPDLIAPTRKALKRSGVPYVIENVEGARRQLKTPIKLCGSMFGLPFWRHRYFELSINALFLVPGCNHDRTPVEAMINGKRRLVQIPVLCTGGGDGKRSNRKTHRPRGKVDEIRWAMGIDWMVQSELTEAIPPAYTKWLGRQLIQLIGGDR